MLHRDFEVRFRAEVSREGKCKTTKKKKTKKRKKKGEHKLQRSKKRLTQYVSQRSHPFFLIRDTLFKTKKHKLLLITDGDGKENG